MATSTGNLEKVKILLNQDNIDVNLPGPDGVCINAIWRSLLTYHQDTAIACGQYDGTSRNVGAIVDTS